jgi:hypothetical protein
MLDEDEEIDEEAARERLASARRALAERAEWLSAAGYPRTAEGFRRLLEETAGGTPPNDRLWRAMARRIGDRYLPEWQLRGRRAERATRRAPPAARTSPQWVRAR